MEAPLETLPLRSPEQLLRWAPPLGIDARRASAPLCAPRRSPGPATEPRVLATHDMQGNYKDDRFVQGARDPSFYADPRWSSIDVFAYFSHNLVVIPPVGWIDAAHRNGTQVLGTFITEGDDGWDACSALLRTPETAKRAARQLARIAEHFGFEGWLINIENMLPPHLVQALLTFLRVLRAELDARVRRPFLIWYDAVTIEGDLYWQNTVNALNRPFFDACDAIFVNYTWTCDTPREVRAEAGDRHLDVFMGVDVFGRGTFGGGRLDSGVAVKAASKAGLSSALFAIGWPCENSSSAEQSSGRWRAANATFWDTIPRLRPTLLSFPFATAFCAGVGTGVHQRGRLVHQGGWYHLGMQSPLPICLSGATAEGVFVSLDQERVYSGSSALLIESLDVLPRHLPLFKSVATVEPAAATELQLRVVFVAHCEAAANLTWMLAGGQTVDVEVALPASTEVFSDPSCVATWQVVTAPALGDLRPSQDAELTAVSVQLKGSGKLWLGCLAIGATADLEAPHAPTALQADVLAWKRENSPLVGKVGSLDVDVSWRDDSSPLSVRTTRWHIWADWGEGAVWVGVAHQPVFGVRTLRLPGECPRVRFFVQPEPWDGAVLSHERSPSVTVTFPSLL